MSKRKLVVGSTVLALAAFTGGAVAATQSSSKNPRDEYLNDVAKRLNVTPAQLNSALKGAAIDQLDAAVKAGKLTQAQADKLKQHIQQGRAGVPFLGPPPGARGMKLVAPGGAHVFLAPVAKYLGLKPARLRTELMSGKSLAQIAKGQGKSTSGLEQAITDAVKGKLDKAVANKRITTAQEQKILSSLSSRIDDVVNATPPKGGVRFRERGFGYHKAFGGGFARPGSFAPAPPVPAGPVA